LAGDAQPTTHIARVEAVDESGDLIYCHMANPTTISRPKAIQKIFLCVMTREYDADTPVGPPNG
jgi:hypothetical protein